MTKVEAESKAPQEYFLLGIEIHPDTIQAALEERIGKKKSTPHRLIRFREFLEGDIDDWLAQNAEAFEDSQMDR